MLFTRARHLESGISIELHFWEHAFIGRKFLSPFDVKNSRKSAFTSAVPCGIWKVKLRENPASIVNSCQRLTWFRRV